MNNNLLDTLTISSIESNDPKNNLLINTEQHIALKKNREDNVNYLECLKEWQDSVSNRLTNAGFYDKITLHNTGHTFFKDSSQLKEDKYLPENWLGEEEKRISLCVELIDEECLELIDELEQTQDKRNPEKILKELCDLLYVVFGLAARYKEFQYLPEAFMRVHKNNMIKVEKGSVRSDGKIEKPAGHLPPDLSDLIEKGLSNGY